MMLLKLKPKWFNFAQINYQMKPTSKNGTSDNFAKTLEAARQEPVFRGKKEMIDFLIANKGKNLFPAKELAEQKRLCKAKMERLITDHPDMLLKDVLSTILKGLPDNFSASQIQLLTKYLIQVWEKSAKANLVAA